MGDAAVRMWDCKRLLESAVLGNRLLEGNPVKGTLAHQFQSTLPHAYKPPTTDSKHFLDTRRESWAKHKLPLQFVRV